MFKIREMKDYQSLRLGDFKKKTTSFNLQDAINEIVDILKYKADQQNIKVHFEPKFVNSNELKLDFNTMIDHQPKQGLIDSQE